MVVKILKSSANFEGINYSERKNDKGQSELLAAHNFEALGYVGEDVKKSDYINYLTAIAQMNSKVKNKQFHAVLSTKGDQHSREELKDLAIKYLKEMGYGKNPYLIYFHNDTNNNHVHIVSSRVDKKGNKIDDTFEKIRSQTAIQKIMGEDINQQLESAIKEAYNYKYATIAQFKLLFELKGWKIQEKNNQLEFIKYGRLQGTKPLQDISKNLSIDYDEKRLKQLRAIFYKYHEALGVDQLKSYLKDKLGLDITLHKAKGHEKPYGYTVIDHAQKNVFKGSQIMPLKKLLSNPTEVGEGRFVNTIIKNAGSYHELDNELTRYGFKTENNYIFSQDHKFLINKSNMQRLIKQDQLNFASEFFVSSRKDVEALSAYYNYSEGIKAIKANEFIKNTFRDLLLGIKGNNNDFEDGLSMHGIKMLQYENSFFFLDERNKIIMNAESIGIDKQYLETNKNYAQDLDLISLLPGIQIQADHEHNDLKRKKRKPKF